MKENEVPEKLYIDFRDRAERTWRCAYTEKAMANDIEYIRTDAFIEKAEEYIYKQLNEGRIECGDIEKFIEEFKKAMKGE